VLSCSGRVITSTKCCHIIQRSRLPGSQTRSGTHGRAASRKSPRPFSARTCQHQRGRTYLVAVRRTSGNGQRTSRSSSMLECRLTARQSIPISATAVH
jgi:hypothetical protein